MTTLLQLEPIVPMQPVQIEAPFDDPAWLYQIKWDGVRMLSYLDETGLRFFNRKLRPRTETYPDMQPIREQLRAQSLILDGEMIGLGADGKPSFSAILKRDLVKSGDKIRKLVRTNPVFYMVWDVLYAEGGWLLGEPLSVRQERLAELVRESDLIRLTDSHPSGTELFRVMQGQGMEGIVCKERSGRYALGEYHPTWKKVKNYRHLDAVVGGATLKSGLVNSLLVGAYQEGELIFIGKAGTGLSSADIQALTSFAARLPAQTSPFVNLSKHPTGPYEQVVWFPPKLTVHIRFLEWTSDLTLRSPIVEGFRDKKAEECVI